MISFNSIAELVELAQKANCPISQIVIQWEMENNFVAEEKQRAMMLKNWQVMEESLKRGLTNYEKSVSGLTGGDAVKLYAYRQHGYTGEAVLSAAASAVGVSEVNAVMGRIVACPTAGSCGIVPAAIYAAAEKNGNNIDEIVDALFTASGIGMVVEANASIAGAYGGCQAECGTAAGMAAGALVQLAGGTPEIVGNAVALAIKNLLGLACDPVAGLVEVPCVKRNGFIAVHAMVAADMAMAGVQSVIPVDDVIDAMNRIGRSMPSSIKETAEGGLATTKTGLRLTKEIFGK
ncbi:MAG: L-serine ammonia-lyase, iron-sulfur-dependent, subunit alpha [Anaerovibrio sp.]|uniref:L-serine dehydratase n=1 Tax=Anaerovibrio slackiae TaxID=2652309 RepID=A0A6I2UGN9_9FIRM|nr:MULTISPECIES: L-serine ammonia-lyase, iron-sulfur-dependent, subunit alpha [Anaerovibrio]MBQ2410723.1 L-serine ammonia-lyase, iron-sulfur-dependent, subunit alpha [Selenomonadaceae bacterium]MBQ5651522.1 L-serine ammonia-lyase, iron-sulfur-dependent, subunit alpha [Selenomonadaceae bacterium]MBQ5733460.1 L-serine ammonia-lyase, iron-sulfur-dependent, subunit alpha [Selenomonadaceae bacterium]MBQ5822518.1 L-serine ammonia-lyase, iron-sulfur-dependent, subunit alpha [Selenomonadaceae bacterium